MMHPGRFESQNLISSPVVNDETGQSNYLIEFSEYGKLNKAKDSAVVVKEIDSDFRAIQVLLKNLSGKMLRTTQSLQIIQLDSIEPNPLSEPNDGVCGVLGWPSRFDLCVCTPALML